MIEVTGISKVYPDGHRALEGINLEIGDGMLGVLGPNGAGKTTFLSILMLALEPTTGDRRYDSFDARRRSDRAAIRRMIGYLPQSFAPVPHLSGFEYLMHVARVREVGLSNLQLRRRVAQLLEEVGLTQAMHRRAGVYSGGMKRRLGVAQALIHSPKLLVVDEPTAGLDPEERIRFRNLISEVAEETAVLLSTHIVEDIEATCQRIAVIAGGGLLFDGAPTILLTRALGKLFEIPPARHRAGTVIGRRAAPEGELLLVYSDTPIDSEPLTEITLEQAYSALLSAHGFYTDREPAP